MVSERILTPYGPRDRNQGETGKQRKRGASANSTSAQRRARLQAPMTREAAEQLKKHLAKVKPQVKTPTNASEQSYAILREMTSSHFVASGCCNARLCDSDFTPKVEVEKKDSNGCELRIVRGRLTTVVNG